MQKTRNLAPPVSGWTGYPLGFAAAVAVTVVAVAAHGTEHPQWTLTALSGAAVVIATVATLHAALASAAVSWALYAGFVLGRRGELTFTAASGTAAAVLGAAVVLGYVVALSVRYARRTVAAPVTIPAPRRASATRVAEHLS